jgi:hypothetical protein
VHSFDGDVHTYILDAASCLSLPREKKRFWPQMNADERG